MRSPEAIATVQSSEIPRRIRIAATIPMFVAMPTSARRPSVFPRNLIAAATYRTASMMNGAAMKSTSAVLASAGAPSSSSSARPSVTAPLLQAAR
jgi:hypothetical protein